MQNADHCFLKCKTVWVYHFVCARTYTIAHALMSQIHFVSIVAITLSNVPRGLFAQFAPWCECAFFSECVWWHWWLIRAQYGNETLVGWHLSILPFWRIAWEYCLWTTWKLRHYDTCLTLVLDCAKTQHLQQEHSMIKLAIPPFRWLQLCRQGWQRLANQSLRSMLNRHCRHEQTEMVPQVSKTSKYSLGCWRQCSRTTCSNQWWLLFHRSRLQRISRVV